MPNDNNFIYSTLEKESLICARCGYCRNVCPIYQTVGWESATPRGKISLARQIFSLQQEEHCTEEFAHRLAQCTLCGACAHECSTDIDTRRLWIELRERIAEMGKSPAGYQALRDNLIANKNITTFDNQERLDWAEDLDDPKQLQPRSGADVCYFVGCVSSFYPQASEIALAVAEILTSADIDFTTLGGEEWCCGFPLLGSGHTKDGRQFIQHNVQRIKDLGIHTIVSSCPSCHHVWTHNANEFWDGYEIQIFHTTEYIDQLIHNGAIQLKPFKMSVTYHDPCDLGRNGGIFDAPRNIIRSIPGVTFIELQRNQMKSLCCGGGGNLQSADPELTNAISALRAEEIKQSGAEMVVSACQQCTKILGMATRKAGLQLKVMDLNQLVLKCLK
jgi:heterodisulfide reductase subunit D